MRGLIGSEEDGGAAHAVASVEADLDAPPLARIGDHGGYAVLGEVDVLDGFVWLDEHISPVYGNMLQMRLKEAEVLRRQGSQKTIVNPDLGGLRHGSLDSRAGAHTSLSRLRRENLASDASDIRTGVENT